MPGGVDIHAHIAGPAVNAARKLSPEEHRADVARAHRDRALRHRAGPCPRRSPPATATRCSATRPSSRPRRRRSPPATRSSELRDTPVIDAAFLVLMGNNLPLFELIRDGAGAGARGDRLVPAGDRRLRRQARQPGRRRDVEARQRQRDVARRRGPRRHAAAGDRDDRRRGARARAAAPGPRPLQQPRRARQLRARRSTRCDTLEGRRAHLAHLQFHAYGGAPGGRPRSRAPELAEYLNAHPEHQRRRRAGDVRPGDDDDRRRAGLRRPARDHPRPLGQRRHRGRDRLRDRPVHLPRAQLRARAAVGDRPRAVPAQPRPVAARAVHRPPQRRLVPQLSAPDPPADGPRVPQRADPAGEPEGDEAHRAARRPRSRVHAGGDRDHHPRRAGAAARAARQGPPRRRRRRRHHDLRRPRGPRGDVRRAALRHQGRAARSSRTASCARPARAACCGSARSTTRASSPRWRSSSRTATACSSRAIPCASRGCSSPRAPSPRSRDEAARGRDRRHVRRGVPDVGRARRDHRGDAGVGARGGALDDRLRHLGDRLQVRGGHRARARSGRDARRAARASARCCSRWTARAWASGWSSASGSAC